jgi:putative hydrolase of the HAD superfamily
MRYWEWIPLSGRKLFLNDSRERLIGAITDPLEIIKDIAWKIDPAISEDTLNMVSRERKIRFKYCLENPPEGVIDSLRNINRAGYPLALISNADVTEVEAWHSTELGSLFDVAIFSCHEGTMKPEPKIFALCLERLKLTGQDCLYVGDGGNDELVASARAGMTAVLTTQFLKTTWPEKIEERRRTVSHEIAHLNEILPLIDRLNKKM